MFQFFISIIIKYITDCFILVSNAIIIISSFKVAFPLWTNWDLRINQVFSSLVIPLPSFLTDIDLAKEFYLFTKYINFEWYADKFNIDCVGRQASGFVIMNLCIFLALNLIIYSDVILIFQLTIDGLVDALSKYIKSISPTLGKISDQFLPGFTKLFISFVKFCLQLLFTSIAIARFLRPQNQAVDNTYYSHDYNWSEFCDGNDHGYAIFGSLAFWIGLIPYLHLTLDTFVPGRPRSSKLFDRKYLNKPKIERLDDTAKNYSTVVDYCDEKLKNRQNNFYANEKKYYEKKQTNVIKKKEQLKNNTQASTGKIVFSILLPVLFIVIVCLFISFGSKYDIPVLEYVGLFMLLLGIPIYGFIKLFFYDFSKHESLHYRIFYDNDIIKKSKEDERENFMKLGEEHPMLMYPNEIPEISSSMNTSLRSIGNELATITKDLALTNIYPSTKQVYKLLKKDKHAKGIEWSDIRRFSDEQVSALMSTAKDEKQRKLLSDHFLVELVKRNDGGHPWNTSPNLVENSFKAIACKKCKKDGNENIENVSMNYEEFSYFVDEFLPFFAHGSSNSDEAPTFQVRLFYIILYYIIVYIFALFCFVSFCFKFLRKIELNLILLCYYIINLF